MLRKWQISSNVTLCFLKNARDERTYNCKTISTSKCASIRSWYFMEDIVQLIKSWIRFSSKTLQNVFYRSVGIKSNLRSDFNGNDIYTVLDEITRKQLIWFGHVDRMDQMRLPKIMINLKPEGRKKRGRPRRTWKDAIYTAMGERGLRVGEWNSRRQWNVADGRRRQTF